MSAKDFSIVMAYDALRICLGQPTRTHRPSEVMRWMRLVLAAKATKRVPDSRGVKG